MKAAGARQERARQAETGPVMAGARLATTPSRPWARTLSTNSANGTSNERFRIANQITQVRHDLASEHVAALFKREIAHIFIGQDQHVEGVEQDVGVAGVVLDLIERGPTVPVKCDDLSVDECFVGELFQRAAEGRKALGEIMTVARE